MPNGKTFVPHADRILVRRLYEDEGNIKTPDNAKTPPSKGIVLSVGDGFRTDAGVTLPMRCKVDDIILFGKYAGADIILDPDSEESLLTMREEEVLGWLSDPVHHVEG